MKMVIYVLAFFILPTVVSRAAEKHPPTLPQEIAQHLRSSIPQGWTIRSDARAIVITRDEQVTLLNPISLPPLPLDDILREFGRKSDYLILLVFQERMTNEQYAELKAKRDHALKVIADNPNIDGKSKYGMLHEESDRYPLPTYFNSQFSIYLHRSDPPPVEVYPESASHERTKILDAISQMMEKYE